MRIERTGEVQPLTPRFERFLREQLGGISLDDVQSTNQRRADYLCLRGLVAIEIKSLEDSPTGRMNHLLDELRERDDWPIFLGSAPADAFIQNMDNPAEVRRDVIERVGRGVINPLKKANRELEAHMSSYPRARCVRVLVLINEDHEEYDPHTVSYILWHAVRKTLADKPRFEHVDAIIYLTERHATIRDDKVTFPVVSVEGPDLFDAPWKASVLQLIVDRWGGLAYGETYLSETIEGFTTIDHIPEVASRSERWRTEYRRNPYLRSLTKNELKDRFDEVALLATLPMLKNSPLKLPPEGMQLAMQCWSDMMQELAERAMPITELPHSAERAIAAAKRLDLAPSVIAWVDKFERENEARHKKAENAENYGGNV